MFDYKMGITSKSSILLERLNQIDCVKLVLAFFVVATHTSPQIIFDSAIVRNVLHEIFHLAVPLFFIFSGFFLWRNIAEKNKKEKLGRIYGWILRIIKLYLVWSLIYLPYAVYGFVVDHQSFVKSIAVYVRNLLLVGENYYSWPLWYLLGMVVAGSLIYVMVWKGWGLKTMCVVAIALLLFGVGLDWCHEHDTGGICVKAYYLLFRSTRNGIFMGLPFMVVGMIIAQKGVIRSNVLCLILMLVGIVLYVYQIPSFAKMWMGIGLSNIFFKMPVTLCNDSVALKCRTGSLVIYCVHMIWVGLFTFLFPVKEGVPIFMLSLVLSLVAARWVIANEQTKWVKILFK